MQHSKKTDIVITALALWMLSACGLDAVDSKDPTRVEIIVPPSQGASAIPPNPGKLFRDATPDGKRSLSLLYPNTGVLFPPNLGRIEIHWLKGDNKNTLFRISFTNRNTNVRVYTRCERPVGIQEDGCIWETTQEAWRAISSPNAGGSALQVQVEATDDGGSGLGASNIVTAEFAGEPINGALYYWTTTAKSIKRFGFTTTQREAEIAVPNTLATGGDRCLGCHTMTSNGRKMFSSSGFGGGGMLIYDFNTNTALYNKTADTDSLVAFASFSPDGNSLVAVAADEYTGDQGNQSPLTPAEKFRANTGLLMFDTSCDTTDLANTCMKEKTPISLGGEIATHVEWSPDGKTIAFTHASKTNPGPPHAPNASGISYVESDGTQWSSLKPWIAPVAGKNRYNPGFSPDAKWIAFNESTCPAGATIHPECDGYSDPSAKIAMAAAGRSDFVFLTAANAPGPVDARENKGDLMNTFPKFAPFTSLYKSQGGEKVYWLTFSSTRAFGLRKPSTTLTGNLSNTASWLWMVAVKQDLSGGDPSFTAFVLPFQDFTTSNHVVMWTQNYVTTN